MTVSIWAQPEMADLGIRRNTHADPSWEKRQACEAASALPGKENDTLLLYTPLSNCVGAWKRLFTRNFSFMVFCFPKTLFIRWVPSQAFFALIEIEPNAEETFTVAVRLQDRPDQLPAEYFASLVSMSALRINE